MRIRYGHWEQLLAPITLGELHPLGEKGKIPM